MIVCFVEFVFVIYKIVMMGFFVVLDFVGIIVFDLSKVIEYFVRYEDILFCEFKRYFNIIEERIFESMVWGKGLFMYNFFIVVRFFLVNEINWLCLLVDLMLVLENVGL